MRILLTLVAVVAFMASATAQDLTTGKKARKAAKTEAVSATPAPATKSCCASKAGASADGAKACDSKAKAQADATGITEAAASEGKTAACCAGKSAGDKKSCHGEGKAHAHTMDADAAKESEETPAAQPEQ